MKDNIYYTMAYLYSQKLNLMELAPVAESQKVVLLAEPEEYLLALYSGYLAKNNFSVKHCSEIGILDRLIGEHLPHLLVMSVNFYEGIPKIISLLRQLKNDYPFLPIVTTGLNLNSECLKEIMSAGIASHLERTLTRPKDIVIIAKTILNT